MQTEMLDSIVSPHSQELPNASSALKLFENPQFRVRVIMRCAEPWFVAKDACDCLTLTDTNKACQNLDDDEKQVVTRDFDSELFSESKAQAMTLISESGLYTLIMRSNKPEAKVFRKWVTSEVLPSIRKTGGYGIRTVDDMINDPDTAIRLLTQLKILRLQNDQLAMERDEAIRTKYHFVEGRDAKVCGELGGLRTQNEALRKQIGDSKTHKAAKAIPWLSEYFNTRNRGLYISLASKLNKIEADMPSEFAHTKIEDSQYGQINAYHVAVIEKLHERVQADEEFMKDYRKDVSPKSKNA